MKIFNLLRYSTRTLNRFPKSILSVFVAAGATYFIANDVDLRKYRISDRPIVIQAAAATDRSDQIKSFNFIADVVEIATPSVVSITVSGSLLGVSFGSGFIVDESGYILTNAHVVSKNPFVSVTLSEGQKFQGEVIAVDRTSDLALIKINPGQYKLKALHFAEISKLRAGEFVIALGSPMTLSNTVTVGVVSAVERDLGHMKGLKYVQTDAIITVGNSGGPLINLYGEVIGVNTMMVSTGFGFAIPSNHCRQFFQLAMESIQPRSSGRSNKSSKDSGRQTPMKSDGSNKYMGVVMGSLTPQMAYESKMHNPDYLVHPTTGVVIHSVFQSSPAHISGILPGDIIESLNGVLIHNTAEFTSVVSKSDRLDIVLIRKGQRVYLKNVEPELV